MATKVSNELTKLLKAVNETPASALWDCHGTWVIKHKALEKVGAYMGLSFDMPTIIETDIKNKSVSVCVQGHRNLNVVDKDKQNKIVRISAWSFGESAPYNTTNKYPFAMAEKRAVDRVILKLIGMHGDLYSEVEADAFQEKTNRGD
tara:strand:+ start:5552 stop:5992 length:441 start_codon:yes stop_codon:yes gene_type:complete